ncbi:hypothetical protein GR268_47145, partial [Rhizobium leguminosarum]|nr:hypothetical protein [Rhizobium leguminosarum]
MNSQRLVEKRLEEGAMCNAPVQLELFSFEEDGEGILDVEVLVPPSTTQKVDDRRKLLDLELAADPSEVE